MLLASHEKISWLSILVNGSMGLTAIRSFVSDVMAYGELTLAGTVLPKMVATRSLTVCTPSESVPDGVRL